jgi:hypothetical protein
MIELLDNVTSGFGETAPGKSPSQKFCWNTWQQNGDRTGVCVLRIQLGK